MDSAAVSESVKGLTAKLSAETTARKNAVAATDKAVGALQTRATALEAQDKTHTAAIGTEVQGRKNAVAAMQKGVDTEISDRKDAVSKTNAALAKAKEAADKANKDVAAEAKARQAADGSINTKIDGVSTDYKKADKTHDGTLASLAKTAASQAASTAAESKARKAKDEELAKKVTAEETARANAVNQLNETILGLDTAASKNVKGLTASVAAIKASNAQVAASVAKEAKDRATQDTKLDAKLSAAVAAVSKAHKEADEAHTSALSGVKKTAAAQAASSAAESKARKAKDEELAKKVTAEETARKDAVDKVSKAVDEINTGNTKVSKTVAGLAAGVAQLKKSDAALVQKDSDLTTSVAEEKKARVAADAQVAASVAKVSKAHKEADKVHADALAAVKKTGASQAASIAVETKARKASDTEFSKSLAAEKSARQSSLAALSKKVTGLDRLGADSYDGLSADVEALKNASAAQAAGLEAQAKNGEARDAKNKLQDGVDAAEAKDRAAADAAEVKGRAAADAKLEDSLRKEGVARAQAIGSLKEGNAAYEKDMSALSSKVSQTATSVEGLRAVARQLEEQDRNLTKAVAVEAEARGKKDAALAAVDGDAASARDKEASDRRKADEALHMAINKTARAAGNNDAALAADVAKNLRIATRLNDTLQVALAAATLSDKSAQLLNNDIAGLQSEQRVISAKVRQLNTSAATVVQQLQTLEGASSTAMGALRADLLAKIEQVRNELLAAQVPEPLPRDMQTLQLSMALIPGVCETQSSDELASNAMAVAQKTGAVDLFDLGTSSSECSAARRRRRHAGTKDSYEVSLNFKETTTAAQIKATEANVNALIDAGNFTVSIVAGGVTYTPSITNRANLRPSAPAPPPPAADTAATDAMFSGLEEKHAAMLAKMTALENKIGDQADQLRVLADSGSAQADRSLQSKPESSDDSDMAMLAIYVGAANAVILLALIAFLLVRSRGGSRGAGLEHQNKDVHVEAPREKEFVLYENGGRSAGANVVNPIYGKQVQEQVGAHDAPPPSSQNRDGPGGRPTPNASAQQLINTFSAFEADANGADSSNQNSAVNAKRGGKKPAARADDGETFGGFGNDGVKDTGKPIAFAAGRTGSRVTQAIAGFDDEPEYALAAKVTPSEVEVFDDPQDFMMGTKRLPAPAAASGGGDGGDMIRMNVAGTATLGDGDFMSSSFYDGNEDYFDQANFTGERRESKGAKGADVLAMLSAATDQDLMPNRGLTFGSGNARPDEDSAVDDMDGKGAAPAQAPQNTEMTPMGFLEKYDEAVELETKTNEGFLQDYDQAVEDDVLGDADGAGDFFDGFASQNPSHGSLYTDVAPAPDGEEEFDSNPWDSGPIDVDANTTLSLAGEEVDTDSGDEEI